jgi:hypothetical protein
MTGRNLFLATLVLPVIGLAASWAISYQKAQQGIEWDVPIRGYDPRDLLRGHYITFLYDWPGLTREGNDFAYIDTLCVKGSAPRIASTSQPTSGLTPPPGCASVAKASSWDEGGNGLGNGIFYVPQAKAAEYERTLRDPKQQGVMRVRIREDGLVRPISLSFRPSPEQR